ncbi:MAG: DUF2339 domain-containing protein [Thermodesulfobacteriota bacterium]
MLPFEIMIPALVVLGGSVAGVVALFLAIGFRRVLHELYMRLESTDEAVRGLREELVATREALGRPIPPTVDVWAREVAKPPMPPEPTPVTPAPPEPEKALLPEPELVFEEAEPRPAPVQPPRTGVGPVQPGLDQQWWAGLEESLGKRWMTWAGAVVLFLSVAFFIKYAFDNQWLGPTGRVVLGIAVGLGLLVAGDHFLRREMRALGQGLMGGGLAVLYLSLFAAFSFYRLVPQIPAFGCMVMVTAVGMTLAVLHEAVPLGIIAALGGLLSPVLVSTGTDARDALFAYVTVLDLGVLGVAFFRRWRVLDCVAFVGTWLLFWGWFSRFYTSAATPPTCLWITVFFLIFLVIPFAYQLRTLAESTVESFLLGIANAVISFTFLYWMLRDKYSFALGFMALAMAACYIVMATMCRSRIPEDAKSLFGFVGLAVVLLTLAVPLHLGLHGILLAWAVEGPVLLFLGYQFNYRPVRIAGLGVLLLAGVRLFWYHWPLHHHEFLVFFNRSFGTAIFLPAAAAAYAVIHHLQRERSTDLDRILKLVAAIAAGFVATVIVQGELGQWAWFASAGDFVAGWYGGRSLGTLVWSLGAAGFVLGFLLSTTRAAYYAGIAALAIAILFCASSYGASPRWDYHLFVNQRFLMGLAVAITAFGYVYVARACAESFPSYRSELTAVLGGLAGIFPLFLLSLEVYSYCHSTIKDFASARWVAQMSLSLVWSVYAVATLVLGFLLGIRSVRLAALGLLGLTAIKLLLVDMATVQQIYRIISFVVLGIMMIVASYLYHRLEKRLAGSTGG